MNPVLLSGLRGLAGLVLAALPLSTLAATETFYIYADHLDTPRLITDGNQDIRWRWDNDDPFGGNMANENPSGIGAFEFNLRFPGQYLDKETNLHYNYYRDYSPELGRYLESDPIGLGGGLNTYSYALSDPLFWVDPAGLLTRPVDPGPVRGPDLGAREGGACGVRRTRNGKNYSHAGVDLLHRTGGNVVAPISGTVSISGSEGVLICQQAGTVCCGNTTKPKLVCYRLVHISPTATRGTVKEGQVVGTVAPQSNPNIPPHVHVEYYEVGCDPDKPKRTCPPFQ